MKVTFSDAVKRRGEEYALLQQASKELEESIGPPAAGVTAEWNRSEDEEGRPLYTLRISDGTDAAVGTLDWGEMNRLTSLRFRLSRLWDDVLKARGDRQFKKLLAMSASES
jgi:hypothetical protein